MAWLATATSGWGLALPDHVPNGKRQFPSTKWGGAPGDWPGKCADKVPDYAMPPFDGIGANEYVVAAAHNACDFISTVDTPAIRELNVWYHTLNCGMTTRISGETDFPCIYGDRVGLGRVYVQLDDDQPLNYQTWIEELKNGRSYCGDGLSHILDFAVNGLAVGTSEKPVGDKSRLDLADQPFVFVRSRHSLWLRVVFDRKIALKKMHLLPWVQFKIEVLFQVLQVCRQLPKQIVQLQ